MTTTNLADALNQALPQTQCTRCGYPDCRSYAQAIADGLAEINQCPPGGAEGIVRLAHLSGRPVVPLNPTNGTESARLLAVIDEAWCIGCTLCIKACPVDCIIGGPKQMHTIIDSLCTGCELCIPVCPVDCISLLNASHDHTGWSAWSQPQADEARKRYEFHRFRQQRDQQERDQRLASNARAMTHRTPTVFTPIDPDLPTADKKREIIEAALGRARAVRDANKPEK